VPFDAYTANRDTGGFILIDRMSNNTVGAGMLHFALRRSHNIHLQHLDIDKAARALLKGQKPAVLWFTGLSGAGKSTIANLVEKKLHAMGRHSYLLDGDNVRHGLNKDLGFTEADRVENIRRVAEVARLMADAGLIVLTAFISPFRAERALARSLHPAGGGRKPRRQGPLCQGAARRAGQLHRHRLALRAAGERRAARQHRRAQRRRRGRPRDRQAARAATHRLTSRAKNRVRA
jgi:hypothetical protein